MHVIPIYLNVDGHVATPVDAYNAVRSTPPSLMRGVRALLCLRLVDDEGNPDDTGIAALVGWEFVLAGDWSTATAPEIRVTTGITVVSTTVGTKTYREIRIPLTELNTEELISKLGNNASADLGAELVGFEAGETDPGFLIQFTMRVYNRRSTAGTGTPMPVSDGLYSAVQIDSLLAMYCTTISFDNKLTSYALTTHNHDGVYAATVHSHALGDVTGLMLELDGKAVVSHTHDGVYALADHNHDGIYAAASHGHAISEIADLESILDGKASADHNHDGVYSLVNHNHDSVYAGVGHRHDADYAAIAHDHGISCLAGTGITIGMLVYLTDAAEGLTCHPAVNSGNGKHLADGFVAGLNAGIALVKTAGVLTLANSLSAGSEVFLGLDGAMAISQPIESGDLVQKVGRVLNGNQVFFAISSGRQII